MTLKWEKQSGGAWWAKSGKHLVGMVVVRFDGKIVWHISAVETGRIAKGNGAATDIPAAKRGLARAWSKWLDSYGLTAAKV